MNTSRPVWLFLLLISAVAASAVAQEPATLETPTTSNETIAEEAAPAVEEPIVEEPITEEPAAEKPVAEEPATEPVVEEESASEGVDVDTETVMAEEVGEVEAADEDATEEIAEKEIVEEENATDWAGLIERAPAFFAVTHHAVIHMPIALWLFGAFFVVVGVVIPSLKNQIPVACLIGGAITSVPAVLSGWWYAEEEWGDDWREFDWASLRENGWDSLELITQHRWIGVALIVASFILSFIAILAYRKENRLLGFIWRVGLIGLAVAVAWEGHIGGEIIQGEEFLEEAFELWLHPE